MLCSVLEMSAEGENDAGLIKYCSFKWVEVFKNGPRKICEDSLYMVCLSGPYHFKFFKGSLPQILLGTFLNTLTHI